MRPSTNRTASRTPEAWFRILYATPPHGKHSLPDYHLTVEATVGPWNAFENGNTGRFERVVAAEDLVSAIPLRKCSRRQAAKQRKRPRPPKPPQVVETLRKAIEWRRQLDAGEVASQAEIARREGVTRARVTQILALLRLAPEVQETVLGLVDIPNTPRLSEKALRPITAIEDDEEQSAAFATVIGHRT